MCGAMACRSRCDPRPVFRGSPRDSPLPSSFPRRRRRRRSTSTSRSRGRNSSVWCRWVETRTYPAFAGGFSPDEREISSHGFKARWRVSRFATGVPAAIAARQSTDLLGKQGCDLSVRFVQPVDVYQQSERAVKYGVLFVALTFVAFFMFETLGRLAIHPIQYALVAGALAIFFLLLISLSEHLPFAVAYVVGSGACVSLLVFYTGHVLGGVTRGLGFGAMLGTLYILLYVILQSED
ncbi:MAG: cell envelope integrity protein CreD [Candidatus Eisenbacteria bacterium]|uniref:Cell envelope integrity protein CreD n=1 Tax=Eiseniibacteriota bacterium TaxID=2212470 RepID=A0A538TWE5_UNCEI|nr:MAG: cell envelope integrity protein CreD [Candidatus Eisenbacteria bacterium]